MTTKEWRNNKTWWKKIIVSILVAILINTILFLPQKETKAEDGLIINYHLTLQTDDHPSVIIEVKNAHSNSTVFVFDKRANALAAVGDLKKVFKNIDIVNSGGKKINWTWKNDDEIVVANNQSSSFSIQYSIDALNLQNLGGGMGSSSNRFAIFRARRIFFIAGDIFPIPNDNISSITVQFTLPKATKIFSSLPEKQGKFIATTDLWGTLKYDFPKSYFTGGHVVFSLTHYTEWGDKYIYIWFDRDPIFTVWLPSYGNTPWEQAEKYMETTEKYAKYFREILGPLPIHTVIFTNSITEQISLQDNNWFPVIAHTGWFNSMQICPKYSDPFICHHTLLQWGFFMEMQGKIALNFGNWKSQKPKIGQILNRGLVTYLENVVPTILTGDKRYEGKIFEFFALDKRGDQFNIRNNYSGQNWFHLKYNFSAAKVFLLDKYIQKVTNGKKNINDFTREIWNYVKNDKKPRVLTDEDLKSIFAEVVGNSNKNYISQWANLGQFKTQDFIDLLPEFQDYVKWMSNTYFWKNKLLFLVFLDISAAKGEEWPHYATYPHNILDYRKAALTPFKTYLNQLNKSSFTKNDIVQAMDYVTGKDHSGFFEFWESLGINLDPNSLLPLNSWDPQNITEKNIVCNGWTSIGTLETEHYLAGIPQKAKAILDTPDDDGVIVIDVRLQSFDSFPSLKEAINALSGENVSLLETKKDIYKNLYLTEALFKVSTNDPEHKHFEFNLVLPSFSSHPIFIVYRYPQGPGSYLGDLYWLHSIDPIDFGVKLNNNVLNLPNTSLSDEKFVVEFSNKKINALPNTSIEIPSDTKDIKISLFDRFGFLRGYKEITIDKTPPDIKINSPTNNSVVNTDTVNVIGMATDSESGIEQVTINGKKISLASDGSFSTIVSLTEGTNIIKIIATDKAGNNTTKTITITYTPPVKTITIILQPDNPYMTVNGISQEIDPGRGTKPVIIPKWSRTVVPIRAIVEALGGTISWDGTERKVTINFNNTVIELWIDNPKAKVNGITKWIDENNHDVRPIIVNDRTMLPLRFVAESLGCQVNWDAETRTITITYK